MEEKELYQKEDERLEKKHRQEIEQYILKTAKILEGESVRIEAMKSDQKRAEENHEIRKKEHEIWVEGRSIYDETEKIRQNAMNTSLESERARHEYYKLRTEYIKLKLKKLKEELNPIVNVPIGDEDVQG